MISPGHINSPKLKIFEARNINVIDLEALYPDKDIEERLKSFLDTLEEPVNDKTKTIDEWPRTVNLSDKDFNGKTEALREICQKYPGWVYLPYKISKSAELILSQIQIIFDKSIFKNYAAEQIIDFVYLYSKFHSLCGRPMAYHVAKDIFDYIRDYIQHQDISNCEEVINETLIYILRTFRENADWESFTACNSIINLEKLSNYNKQFVYAENCRKSLWQFEIDECIKQINSWEVTINDVYWAVIKASMIIRCGYIDKGIESLKNNLVQVRKQLSENPMDLFLQTTEEITVNLFNYVMQSKNPSAYKENDEEPENQGDLSWWDSYEKYSLRIDGAQKKIGVEYSISFNLTSKVTDHIGKNKGVQYSREFWRFCEVSGFPFRIGIIVSNNGLEQSLKHLSKRYPYWTFLQIASMGKSDYIDSIYGRNYLSEISQNKADEEITHFISIMDAIIKRPLSNDKSSMFYQTAHIVPEIIGRLCTKCSLKMLDESLELLYKIGISDEFSDYSHLSTFEEQLFSAYSYDQIQERIERILRFPHKANPISGYKDPLTFIHIGSGRDKFKCSDSIYYEEVNKAKEEITRHDEESIYGIQRLAYLFDVIGLKKEEIEFFIEQLKEDKSIQNLYSLYILDSSNKKAYCNEIARKTFDNMKDDAKDNSISFSVQRLPYQELLYIIRDIDFRDLPVKDYCGAVENLLNRYCHYNASEIIGSVEMKSIVTMATSIGAGLIVNISAKDFLDNVKSNLNQLVSNFEKNFGAQPWIDLLKLLLEQHGPDKNTLKKELWQCDKDNLHILTNVLIFIKDIPEKFNIIEGYINVIEDVISSRSIEADLALLPEQYNVLKQVVIILKDSKKSLDTATLDISLERYLDISYSEDEQEARSELLARKTACELAKVCWDHDIKIPAVEKWKEKTIDPMEFSVIRTSWS